MEQMWPLKVDNASKTFGENLVLDAVNLTLKPGQIHALLGHNGSGKSTLIKILAGVYHPDIGTDIYFHGKKLEPGQPKQVYEQGLRFVHQRLTIIEKADAIDNLAVGKPYRMKGKFRIDWTAQAEEAQMILDEYCGVGVWDARDLLEDAPAIVKSQFAIGRALQGLDDRGILILDEPTASLAPAEVSELFRTLEQVAARGVAILYVTHRLREVYEIADYITLLRDGKCIASKPTSELLHDELVELLIGDEDEDEGDAPVGTSTSALEDVELAPAGSQEIFRQGTKVLEVRDLRGETLNGVDLDVYAGEVLGVYGLAGSGRESLGLSLVGGTPADYVSYRVNTTSLPYLSIDKTLKAGVVLARESRMTGALVNKMSIAENITLPVLKRFYRSGKGLDLKREKYLASDWIQRLEIRPRNYATDVQLMSGGNRQKVVIAKSLETNPSVLVLDDPTAGVDVGAARILRDLFRDIARDGQGVILISSDIDEICQVSDRVLVLDQGVIARELTTSDEINEKTILAAVS